MDREAAESLAIQALSFLAQDVERLGRFLALTGVDPREIRKVARDPGFLAAVLEHVAADESLLLACADYVGRSPGELAAAKTVLGCRPFERDTA
jgi:hypothetical protein